MRTRYLSLDAIVLRARPQGEADAWVTLLAPVAGIISGVAKNGLRSQKRFMGALMPVTRADVLLARRQGAWYLEEAEVTRAYRRLKTDVSAYALACYSVEQVLQTHPHGPEAADAFPLLAEHLDQLEGGDPDLPLARLAWDLRLMEGLGVAPHLADCVVCGMEVTARSPAFHGPSGGLLCEDHAAEQSSVLVVQAATVELLQALLAGERPAAGPRIRKQARGMTDAHMAWHMPVELRSKRVLEQLSRLSTRQTRP